MRKKRETGPPKSLGEVLEQRRLELGLTQEEAGRRIINRKGEWLSAVRFSDLEKERKGIPRLPILKQLPRALRLDPDVVYFWAGRVPPGIEPASVSEAAVKAAWTALREVIARRRRRPAAASAKRQVTAVAAQELRGPRLHGWRGRATLGGLIEWRRRQLGLTRAELGARLKTEEGQPLSHERVTDIAADRYGVPRRHLLRQLARALKLDLDTLYLWAGRLPPDVQAKGLSEAAIKEAWDAFRAMLKRGRMERRSGARDDNL